LATQVSPPRIHYSPSGASSPHAQREQAQPRCMPVTVPREAQSHNRRAHSSALIHEQPGAARPPFRAEEPAFGAAVSRALFALLRGGWSGREMSGSVGWCAARRRRKEGERRVQETGWGGGREEYERGGRGGKAAAPAHHQYGSWQRRAPRRAAPAPRRPSGASRRARQKAARPQTRRAGRPPSRRAPAAAEKVER